MIAKAPHGTACNNCGLCCEIELCPLGAHLFKRWEGPCPALESVGETKVCGLIAHPEVYAIARTLACGKQAMTEAAMHLVGAGFGCDGQQEGEPYNEEFGRRMRANRSPSRTRRALRVWGLDTLARTVK